MSASKKKPQFDVLVDAHAREIYSYLWRMLQDEQDAEDCLQDAFLKAYLAYDRLDGTANYRAWLYRIAGNTARTCLRGRLRTGVLLTENIADPGLPVEQQAQNRHRLGAVRNAIEALPYKQRESLILRKYQGLTYEEVGSILDTSAEGARANVYQGLRKLRLQFEDGESLSVPNMAEENSEVG
ncbi:MAG: RNA polymerase sigma factor [Anaerolineales bacterium]